MRKKEVGQAFILVLILLAIGTMLVIPTLRLTGTALKSSQIVQPRVRALYVADAAQEFILWKLLHDNLGVELMESTDPNPSAQYAFDVCGVPVGVGVYMRAVPGQGGIILSTNDVIQPTKSASPDTILNEATVTVTYTIRLEQLSANTTQGLEVLYDILPTLWDDSEYVTGSSYVRVDDGEWVNVPDPALEAGPVSWRMRWPADGEFSSDPGSPNYFNGMRDFIVRQVKELRFQMGPHAFKGEDKDVVHCNWVALKPWNTLSGPQAPISVGDPANPGVCDDDGLLEVYKVSDPMVIPPGVETDIEYTIKITNQDGFTHHIEEITDYLPPGFDYTGPVSGFTTLEPIETLEEVNGVERWKLYWVFSPSISIAAAGTENMTFEATATKDVSGSYYNEVLVVSDVPIPQIFAEIGITEEDFYTSYSWNTGAVMVPAFDSSANATGVTINANMSLILGGISVSSWQVD